jgi:hypothetical protein
MVADVNSNLTIYLSRDKINEVCLFRGLQDV